MKSWKSFNFSYDENNFPLFIKNYSFTFRKKLRNISVNFSLHSASPLLHSLADIFSTNPIVQRIDFIIHILNSIDLHYRCKNPWLYRTPGTWRGQLCCHTGHSSCLNIIRWLQKLFLFTYNFSLAKLLGKRSPNKFLRLKKSTVS